MRDIDALTAERDRIESELRQFEERQETLEKDGAGLLGQTKAAEDDEEALAKLKIELEQLAEAKRENDRSIEQSTKRLEEIETLIAMQEQSDMS
jgi:predicted  nucleic acid-binding Zn-ribbon protein